MLGSPRSHGCMHVHEQGPSSPPRVPVTRLFFLRACSPLSPIPESVNSSQHSPYSSGAPSDHMRHASPSQSQATPPHNQPQRAGASPAHETPRHLSSPLAPHTPREASAATSSSSPPFELHRRASPMRDDYDTAHASSPQMDLYRPAILDPGRQHQSPPERRLEEQRDTVARSEAYTAAVNPRTAGTGGVRRADVDVTTASPSHVFANLSLVSSRPSPTLSDSPPRIVSSTQGFTPKSPPQHMASPSSSTKREPLHAHDEAAETSRRHSLMHSAGGVSSMVSAEDERYKITATVVYAHGYDTHGSASKHYGSASPNEGASNSSSSSSRHAREQDLSTSRSEESPQTAPRSADRTHARNSAPVTPSNMAANLPREFSPIPASRSAGPSPDAAMRGFHADTSGQMSPAPADARHVGRVRGADFELEEGRDVYSRRDGYDAVYDACAHTNHESVQSPHASPPPSSRDDLARTDAYGRPGQVHGSSPSKHRHESAGRYPPPPLHSEHEDEHERFHRQQELDVGRDHASSSSARGNHYHDSRRDSHSAPLTSPRMRHEDNRNDRSGRLSSPRGRTSSQQVTDYHHQHHHHDSAARLVSPRNSGRNNDERAGSYEQAMRALSPQSGADHDGHASLGSDGANRHGSHGCGPAVSAQGEGTQSSRRHFDAMSHGEAERRQYGYEHESGGRRAHKDLDNSPPDNRSSYDTRHMQDVAEHQGVRSISHSADKQARRKEHGSEEDDSYLSPQVRDRSPGRHRRSQDSRSAARHGASDSAHKGRSSGIQRSPPRGGVVTPNREYSGAYDDSHDAGSRPHEAYVRHERGSDRKPSRNVVDGAVQSGRSEATRRAYECDDGAAEDSATRDKRFSRPSNVVRYAQSDSFSDGDHQDEDVYEKVNVVERMVSKYDGVASRLAEKRGWQNSRSGNGNKENSSSKNAGAGETDARRMTGKGVCCTANVELVALKEQFEMQLKELEERGKEVEEKTRELEQQRECIGRLEKVLAFVWALHFSLRVSCLCLCLCLCLQREG
jgi:hypothetical protein